jgi:hypothetical protein
VSGLRLWPSGLEHHPLVVACYLHSRFGCLGLHLRLFRFASPFDAAHSEQASKLCLWPSSREHHQMTTACCSTIRLLLAWTGIPRGRRLAQRDKHPRSTSLTWLLCLQDSIQEVEASVPNHLGHLRDIPCSPFDCSSITVLLISSM